MTRFTRLALSLATLAPLTFVACGDDPIAHSEVVSIKLSGFKPGDFTNNMSTEDKSINTESGNPYGVFLKNAKAALGGKDPSSIEVVGLTVQVHAESKNVTTVDAVFADLEVFISTSDTTIPIAAKATPKGSSVVMTIDEDIDYGAVKAELIKGEFKMGVRGSGINPLPADFELKLTLDIRFEAFE